jgi:endonuclease/exonuclease/phosphatase family metal-dependent hydrolase
MLLVLLAAIGSWFFYSEMSVQKPDGSATDPPQPLGQKLSQQVAKTFGPQAHLTQRPNGTIRVATLNLDNFDATKAARQDIVDVLAQILTNFDVIALQDITAGEQNVVPRLVDAANSAGGNFDFVIGPRVGRDADLRQFAFVYDRARIEVDRYQFYSVQDPDDLLKNEPLVGWFRVRGIDPDEAFTFSLVNMLVDAQEANRENAITRAVFEEVRNDSRDEDDVILLGDFSLDAPALQQLTAMPSAIFIIQNAQTNPQQDRSNINLIADRHATVELTGRSGVFDFLRELNLSMEQALTISKHLPVWAEFVIYEGGEPGRVAASAGGREQGTGNREGSRQ